jgi:hypothetical protein
MMFLDDEELTKLTGYKRKSSQIDWLRKNGIKHLVNGLGEPLVTQKQLDEILCSGKTKSHRTEPDEQALKKLLGLDNGTPQANRK